METPSMEELLKKILKLQKCQDELNEEMSRLKLAAELRKRSHPPPRRNTGAPPWRKTCAAEGSRDYGSMNSAGKFTNKQYLNILQSMSQSVHVLDGNDEIIFWSPMSEDLYGYSAAEVIGQNPLNVLIDEKDVPFALSVARRCCDKGEIWTGEFPIKNKSGKIIQAICTCSPFHDDNGSLIGIITITTLYRNPSISLVKSNAEDCESSFIPERNSFASKGAVISELDHESDQPIRVDVFATKARSKTRAGVNTATLSEDGSDGRHRSDHVVFGPTLSVHEEDAVPCVDITPRGEFFQSPFGIFTHNDEQEGTWGQNEQEKEKYHQIKPTTYV